VPPLQARAPATRSKREPPSDAEIERGLRERAVNSARDAEVLLRWRQTVRLATLDETVLAALVEHVLAGDELVSSS
jgi:hypothetical protein